MLTGPSIQDHNKGTVSSPFVSQSFLLSSQVPVDQSFRLNVDRQTEVLSTDIGADNKTCRGVPLYF